MPEIAAGRRPPPPAPPGGKRRLAQPSKARRRTRAPHGLQADLRLLRCAWANAGRSARRAFLIELLDPSCDDARLLTASALPCSSISDFYRLCIKDRPGSAIKARALYGAYIAFCAARGTAPMAETRFGREMKKLIERDDRGSVHLYVGIELRCSE